MTTPTERRELLGRAVTACSVVAEAQDLCTRAEREAWHLVGDAFSALADAEDCEQVDDDRDELAGTVERLYDGIDAAIRAAELELAGHNNGDALRILTNLRAGGQTPTPTTGPPPTLCKNCGEPIQRDSEHWDDWVHPGNSYSSYCDYDIAEPRTETSTP